MRLICAALEGTIATGPLFVNHHQCCSNDNDRYAHTEDDPDFCAVRQTGTFDGLNVGVKYALHLPSLLFRWAEGILANLADSLFCTLLSCTVTFTRRPGGIRSESQKSNIQSALGRVKGD
jgi:hypothetical protein